MNGIRLVGTRVLREGLTLEEWGDFWFSVGVWCLGDALDIDRYVYIV